MTEVTIKATRDSLAEIVKAEPKKYSQAELGRMLSVSRARVHELIKRLDLGHLVRPKHWSFYCLDCGKPIHRGSIRCRACWLKIYGAKMVTLTCDFPKCGKQFERKESEAKRHKFHFCSKNCRGDYARHYGFGDGKAREKFKMPEPSPNGRKLKTRVFELYTEGYSSLVQAAQAMGISNSEIYRVRDGKRPINEKFIIGALKAFPGYKLGELFYVVPDNNNSIGQQDALFYELIRR